MHHWLIIEFARFLSPQLRPKYRVKEVVTAITILSPANKRSGKGHEQYEAKRNQVLGTSIHLVEIDLLRKGQPMLVYHSHGSTDYRILVSRGDRRPQADLYGFNLRDRIPSFPFVIESPTSCFL